MKKFSLILSFIILASCSKQMKDQFSSLGSSVLGAAGVSVSEQSISNFIDAGESLNKAARGFSEEQEYYLGRAVSAMVLQKFPLDSSQVKTKYLNQVGNVVASVSPRPLTFSGYHFGILKSQELNALSAPSGFVFVTEGLLQKVNNEDELAAILAHEVAHVVLGHGMAAISQSNVTSALSLAGKEALSFSDNSITQQLVGSFGDSAKEVFDSVLTKGYSRSQEYEADLLAFDIMKRAGYQPAALISMLKAIESKQAKGGWYDTHPESEDRVEEIEDEAGSDLKVVENPGFLARKARFNKVF